MQKKKTALAAWAVLLMVGCAGSSSDPSSSETQDSAKADPIVGTAYYGLSVKDCNQDFLSCFDGGEQIKNFSMYLACEAELAKCLGDVSEEAVKAIESGTEEVRACGDKGLTCYAEAASGKNVLDCNDQLQVCVNTTVKEKTGIDLPTTREVAQAAADATEHAVDTAVDTAQTAAETAVDVAHTAAETAVDVAHTATETAVHAAETATDAAVGAAQRAAATARQVADAATYPARHAIECATEAQKCRWDGGKFVECSEAYRTCLFTPPSEGATK